MMQANSTTQIAVWAVVAAVLAGTLTTAKADAGDRQPAKRDLRDVIGVTHVAGKYHLTDKPFLAEGADEILSLGSRVIKLYLTLPPERNYPFNSQWPEVNTLVDLAHTGQVSQH